MFFMHIKDELDSGSLQMEAEQAKELCAVLAQAEHGDYNQNTAKYCSSQIFRREPNLATINSIQKKHRELEGLSQSSAEYRALQLVSSLENYGVEWHWARDSEGQRLAIGVGPEGVTICQEDFSPINRCDTVTSDVMMQYSRDFKGHLASLFLNESINLGKKYVFDIRRTSKEVYDHCRRVLYNAGIGGDCVSGGEGKRSPSRSPGVGEEGCEGCQRSRVLEEKLQQLQDALLCILCCEEQMDAAFCPCGHMVCCHNCAAQLEVCPVCRSEVDHVQHVYLPTCANLLAVSSAAPFNIPRDLAAHLCSSREFYTSTDKICHT
ncbi:unnamed protein product [Coregonus sp. 'balchen']|nr:unnamed protein product [Coregonus sp. 'balchen']